MGWTKDGIDQRHVRQAVKLGAWDMLAALALISAVQFLPGTDHMPLVAYLAVAVTILAMATAGLVGSEHVSDGDHRRKLFYVWSLANVALVSVTVGFSGGGRSELYVLYVLTSLFHASYYTRRVQAWLAAATAIGYGAALAANGWDMPLSTLLVRVSVIALVAVTGSFVAAEKDRVTAESARRAALLRAVAATAREVNVADPGQVLAVVVDALRELGLLWGHVAVIDHEAGTYQLVKTLNIPEEYASARPPMTAGLVGLVWEARSTVVLSGEAAKTYVVPVLEERAGLTAVIGTPLWADGVLAGILAGASKQESGLRSESIEAFELLAGVASRALEGANRFQQMAESEARTRYQASHDDLTGLPNRGLLQLRLREALAWADVTGNQVALLLVDLDDFKLVNDTLGHGAGDELLVTIASRLAACVRDSDTVARLSGDEFAILVRGSDQASLDRLATRVLQTVGEPSDVGGHSVPVDASIGIAVRAASVGGQGGQGSQGSQGRRDGQPTAHPSDAAGPPGLGTRNRPPAAGLAMAGDGAIEAAATELLSNSDVAMYEAKRAGKHCYVVFDQAMSDRLLQRMRLEAELPKAIEAGEMAVYYQPIFDLATRSITGFEALLRWSSAVLGNVPPSDFIPVAEDTGSIVPIGRWVLRQACEELQALRLENPEWAALSMSVNLSTRQLRDASVVDDVLGTLSATGIPAAQLTLEITESSLLHDAAGSQAKLSALGTLGVKVALDDFGTGYSSLAYLQQLHVHCLKIDKSFVDGVVSGSDPTAPALIRSIADLSASLGLDTVAEGIESQEQLAELANLGCRHGQGYVVSPALPPAKVRALLAQHVALAPR